MKILRIDFETRSRVDLNRQESVGVWNYACHPTTEVLFLSYKIDKGQVKQWFPIFGEPMPADLKEALGNSDYRISAFNSSFERYILQHKLGITIPPSRFEDPQVGCRYLSMPGDLGEASDILGLPSDLRKDPRGDTLIKLFCEPHERKKKDGGGLCFNDWNTHPAEWEEFKRYGARDIVAEEEVTRRLTILEALPLPAFERELWEFDQLVNDRGIPVDVDFVKKAYAIATEAKADALKYQNQVTGLKNSNSRDQLLPWAKERGYPFNTLRKATVDSVLRDPEVMLTEDCRKVLTARREAASTSYQKLSAIMRQVSPDGRLRGQFIFMGSPRCGRWAGGAVQLHNLARPGKIGAFDFEKMSVVQEARDLVKAGDYTAIKEKYGQPLLVIKYVIRTVFSVENLK